MHRICLWELSLSRFVLQAGELFWTGVALGSPPAHFDILHKKRSLAGKASGSGRSDPSGFAMLGSGGAS